MASYRIELRRSAAKEIEDISHKKQRQQIVERIAMLADDPRPPGCQRLSGHHYYRIRQGTYRIIYTIEDDRLIVTVVRVRHRRDIYKLTE